MITYEFTAGKEPRIFSVTKEERLSFELDMMECPITLYIPRYEAGDKLQKRIETAITKMVAELNTQN